MEKDLKKLELNRLFKEFGFLKIDEEYKNEIQGVFGPLFKKAVQNIFKENPDMNLLFNSQGSAAQSTTPIILDESKLIGIELYNPTDSFTELSLYTGTTDTVENKSEPQHSDEVKKLYRKISTKTHPDKVSIKFINDLYIKAQTAYKKEDIFTLYLICNDIDIEYEFNKDKLIEFKGRIKTLKLSNSFVEQTYLWVWLNEEDEIKKKNILLHFISNQYGNIA